MKTTMTFIKRIMNALIDARERSAQKRTGQYLLGLSDRYLEDIGFSRELLEQGPKAWPWRAPQEPLGTPKLIAAMRGLNTDSEAQPTDLERDRRGIEEAVRLNLPDTGTKLAA